MGRGEKVCVGLHCARTHARNMTIRQRITPLVYDTGDT